jgi:hypothetical protein
VSAGRYRVTVAVKGRPVVRGWWAVEATARRKLASWVGEYGSVPGARVTLVDEEQGVTLTSWPEEP